MTPDEREKALERVADLFILTLETAVDGLAQVIGGHKRVALVPRTHPKVKANGGVIWELRLTSVPEVKIAPDPAKGILMPEELDELS